ncbi:ABC transporter ATP-binding protein [Duganella sp. Leaf126]|uniref:ABC-F family ATP-binding cassette domain-containing protein n=1 Tax=Duganella sp. Leaf126 TaxID=1736266 RepID=UPI0006F9276E|nr:ABC-F family ATP-binding cassette domain-containing protein [Duganella sp. Leaf126]KQQ47604.1 ABC transporter ATP-binding protein [Duganella sp. Leaf126]
MTQCSPPSITLDGVSYSLPDGSVLFSDLHEQFNQRPTGLVGRNGVGKTVLARILAGQLAPSSGRCIRHGAVYYLAQQVTPAPGATIADLAGMRPAFDALTRIAAGSVAIEDFDLVDARWDLPQQLQQELDRIGLGRHNAQTPASVLSGGEAMRVALAGAMLSGADFLILDEPSNHLDRHQRQALTAQLQRWQRGLLVVSHDRQLLEIMESIIELSPQGLVSHGGNYSFYAAARAHQRQNALDQLDLRKLERHRAEQAMRTQRERQHQRQAHGARQGRDANQAKILLGQQKQRSESSAGKLRQQQDATRERLSARVGAAAQQVQDDAGIVLHTLPTLGSAHRRVVELDGVELPFVPAATRSIGLSLTAQQRVGVIGPNGCGKSTLLQVLAGRLAPLAGRCQVVDGCVYLDQHLVDLDPARTVLAQLLAANRSVKEATLRTWLSQLGLDAPKIVAPSGALSGGERLKAALACVLYADPPAPLLLLDEPGNHLDLPSLQALEITLRNYRGALLVVSHDDVFLHSLGLTDKLSATEQGWQLDPW